MSEIKISIDDQHLQAFLAYLRTLSYVQVEKVSNSSLAQKAKGSPANATEMFLDKLPSDSHLRQAIKPIRTGKVTAEQLIHESGYVRTDWNKVTEIGATMDIPQSTEELLAQLTA